MDAHKVSNNIRQLNLLLYAGFVIFQVLALSSWHYFLKGFGSTTSLTPLIILVAILCFGLLLNWSFLRISLTLCLILAIFIYYENHGLQGNDMLFILISIISGAGVNGVDIVKTDFLARLGSTLLIVLMSVVRILPFSGNGSVSNTFYINYTMGFLYPNTLGYIVLILFLEYLFFIKKEKHQFLTNSLAALICLLLEIYLNYATGITSVLLSTFIYFNKSKISTRAFAIANILVLCVSFITFWLVTIKYNLMNDFWIFINNLLSNRPAIWQYYFQEYPIKWLGNIINVQESTVIGHGAIDGGYFYLLLKYGILSLVILFLVIIFSINRAKKYISINIFLIFTLIIFISGFVETLGFLPSYSPIYLIIGFLLFSSKDNLKMTNL